MNKGNKINKLNKDRREIKRRARGSLREHYGLWVILCAVLTVVSGGSLLTFGMRVADRYAGTGYSQIYEPGDGENTGDGLTGMAEITDRFARILLNIRNGNRDEEKRLADEKMERDVRASEEKKGEILGRSRGVLSQIVNRFTSGAFLISLTVGISSVIGSDNAAAGILIIVSLVALFALWFFLLNIAPVIMIRMFLEGQRYRTVRVHRILFLLKVRKWLRVSTTMFVKNLYEFLWAFTIVGGIVKHYSYYLVPYIVAENPNIRPGEAILLSRRLMRGHKWECFLLQLSFIGWEVLGIFTAGLSNVFLTRPYRAVSLCEFYTSVRRQGQEKKIENSWFLNDTYLFEKPDPALLEITYGDVIREEEKLQKESKGVSVTGIYRTFIQTMGLTFFGSEEEKEFEKIQILRIRLANDKEELEGEVYPSRLSSVPEVEKSQRVFGMNYLRCYSIWSVIMIFFMMSFGGWLWEVGLHLITDGIFVNRGFLHGPWLPIYGTGSVLLILGLYTFRKNPAAEFVMAMVVCGTIEYFTAYALETLNNGQRWWDYTGYFLNLHGRICAEGLLVFGVGGMIIVYFLAPVLDNVVRMVPLRIVIVISLVLSVLFCADLAYSQNHPNTGKGITAYSDLPDPLTKNK